MRLGFWSAGFFKAARVAMLSGAIAAIRAMALINQGRVFTKRSPWELLDKYGNSGLAEDLMSIGIPSTAK